GGRGGRAARRLGRRLGRVLPISRRAAAGDRGRCHGVRPAGRVRTRLRGDRRLRRGARRHGLYGPPPLPPLARSTHRARGLPHGRRGYFPDMNQGWRAVGRWLGRWALLAGLWLALTDTHKEPELIAGAVTAVIG